MALLITNEFPGHLVQEDCDLFCSCGKRCWVINMIENQRMQQEIKAVFLKHSGFKLDMKQEARIQWAYIDSRRIINA